MISYETKVIDEMECGNSDRVIGWFSQVAEEIGELRYAKENGEPISDEYYNKQLKKYWILFNVISDYLKK